MPGIVQLTRYRVRPNRATPALGPSCAPSDADPATPPVPAAVELTGSPARGHTLPRHMRRVRVVGLAAFP